MGTTKIKRYSESFKRQVVREYEAGASAHYLRQKYGIGGTMTIKRWVQKYGKEGFRTEQVLICSPEDQPRFRQMEQRIKELEGALTEAGIRSSMGAVGNAYDNALAERVNGILKIEYLLDSLFPSKAQAMKAVAQAVHLYNFERPHLSLGYATPAHIFGLI